MNSSQSASSSNSLRSHSQFEISDRLSGPQLLESSEESPRIRIRKKPRIAKLKFRDVPPINSLADLILISNSFKFYKNLDTLMLWKISPILEKIDAMIGMEKLKKSLLYQILYYLQGMHVPKKKNDDEGEFLHTLLLGKPGSGKTTIAKLIGELYKAMAVLSPDGVFKQATRADLIGKYLGSTAIKTKTLLKSCLGGVLLIDEIYSLSGGNVEKDSFSKECIDTITAFLSEHKNNFCLIACGYEDEVERCFLSMNPGLRRRFSWKHIIEDYSTKDLCKIFFKKLGSIGWETVITEEFLEKLFRKNQNIFSDAGGSVELYLTKCKIAHSRRVFGRDSTEKYIITEPDLIEGISLMESTEKKDSKPPYGMYL